GREFVANDVVETIKYYANKDNAANILPAAQLMKSPKAVDNYTVEINFDQPMATIYDGLDLLFIIDPENIDGMRNKPNGTGPFKLDSWQPNSKSTYKRFENYWKQGMPYLDSYEVSVWPDPQAMVVSLESGTVDMANPLPPIDAKRLKADAKYQLSQDRFGIVFDVVMNVNYGPLKDKKVRQAISWAINRQRFCDTYLQGLSEPWSLPWPSFSPAYDEKLNGYFTYNPDKAKQLLAEAGYADGFPLTLLTTKSRTGYQELAEYVQNDLGLVGIKVTLDVQDEASWRPKFNAGDFQLGTHNFGRNNKTPTSMFETAVVWRYDKNSANFKSDQFTNLCKSASATVDTAKAKTYWEQLNQLILDECFTLCIAPQPRPAVMASKVQGYTDNLDAYPILEGVWLNQ
ncbi:MAG: ABC transporter substrate-binding protein, partial [Chloroflexota bacterium]